MELSKEFRKESHNLFKAKGFGMRCDICNIFISMNPFDSKGNWNRHEDVYFIQEIYLQTCVCKKCHYRFNRNIKNGHPEKNILGHCKLCNYPAYTFDQAMEHVKQKHMNNKS